MTVGLEDPRSPVDSSCREPTPTIDPNPVSEGTQGQDQGQGDREGILLDPLRKPERPE